MYNSHGYTGSIRKLDGVGPVDNRLSTYKLHPFVQKTTTRYSTSLHFTVQHFPKLYNTALQYTLNCSTSVQDRLSMMLISILINNNINLELSHLNIFESLFLSHLFSSLEHCGLVFFQLFSKEYNTTPNCGRPPPLKIPNSWKGPDAY